MAPTSAVPRAASSASRATCRVTAQISSASCSTQPGWGKCWVNSSYARPTGIPSRSMAKARTPVVPASIATTMGCCVDSLDMAGQPNRALRRATAGAGLART